ncbi:rho GTPase-activating protein 22-like isoform X3 [Ruditapes philippinarum]|uniref:rho GTPase-activating protein 22-like isoform X3 n=1 Tax=Ruditapes philippinarum TaxID=129788 RepID=UPI00295C28D3|nr:rho GTPase-activating protein 22-like isoform X3 [Ruditapes philippinarum]
MNKRIKAMKDWKRKLRRSMSSPAAGGRQNKCGWLRKQGGMVKSWHRRWFVLNADYLFYFAKEDDVRPLGMIHLPGNKIIQHQANPEEPDKFLFELMPGSQLWRQEEDTETYFLASKLVDLSLFNMKLSRNPQKMAPNHESFLLSAATDAERQDWIKAIRKVMFASIGGAIFGTALEETMEFEKKRSKRKVPLIIESCIEFLTEHGLEVEGIFRLPGRMLLVRDLKDRFDEGEIVTLDIENIDVHSVASLLKQYFRELPECLIPYKFYQEFMNIAMKFQGTKCDNNRMEQVQSLRAGMADLPQDNYNALKYLCNFLRKVANKTEINKMTPQNLARVFGPNIIRHPQMEDNPEMFMLTTSDISEQLAYMMINFDTKIFTIEFDEGRKSAQVAVDDLLRIDSVSSESDLLQPLTHNGSSAVNDLSDITFDHPRDRRARSFKPDLLVETDKANKYHLNSDLGGVMSPQSAEFSPTTPMSTVFQSPLSFDNNGKPIPPLRRKYTRKHKEVSAQKSNESISSECSSENSLDSAGESNLQSNTVTSLSNHQSTIVTFPTSERNTAVLELESKLETMTAEYNTLKMKYDNLNASKSKADERVKNLSAENTKIQSRYEDHIKNLEAKHKSHIEDLAKKLENEKASTNEAVQKIVDLQKSIHNYQMQYGDLKNKLPPLYQN